MNSYLRAIAEIYAIADFYAREGDPELKKQVLKRAERDGYNEEQIKDAIKQLALEIIKDH